MLAGNDVVKAGLCKALGALYALNDTGATVLDVQIDGGIAVLRVDRPPPQVGVVSRVTRRIGRDHERLCMAKFLGARIEWTEQLEARPWPT